MTRNRPAGFTMIELMIVVAIIGILAAIAIPKFADFLEKAREGSTKGNVGVLKSANAIYYGDNTGHWPETLDTGIPFRYSMYIDGIPAVKVTGKFDAASLGFSPVGFKVVMSAGGEVPVTRASGWLYDSTMGGIYVDSTLQDSKHIPYSFYGFE